MIVGKVKHSQPLSAPALQPWVAVEKNGLIICAHCTCMAGLGEACSHEYEMRKKDNHSDFILSPSGLVLSSENPHFGASLDGIASCTCCAKRVLEVKCPYS